MNKWERRADFVLRRKSLQAQLEQRRESLQVQLEQNRWAKRQFGFSIFNSIFVLILSGLVALIAIKELTFGVQSQKEENTLKYIELHASGTIAEDVKSFDSYIVKYDEQIFPLWIKKLDSLSRDPKNIDKKGLQNVVNEVALQIVVLAVEDRKTPGAILRLARFYDLIAQCAAAEICDNDLLKTAFWDQVYNFWSRTRFTVICERTRFENLGKKLEIYVREVSGRAFAQVAKNCNDIVKTNDSINVVPERGPQI